MTERGGKRRGAGRPKGAVNKASEEARVAAEATGEMPREYMLRVMRDETADVSRRDDMAKAAAPYFHNRLSSVEHGGKDGSPITHVSRIERVIIDPANSDYAEDTDAEGVPSAVGAEDIQGR